MQPMGNAMSLKLQHRNSGDCFEVLVEGFESNFSFVHSDALLVIAGLSSK